MTVNKTALYAKHISLGAQMVDFKNTWLPLRYKSENEEHLLVRQKVGIFDVSHMGEFLIEGVDARDFLQITLSNNIDELSVHKAQYSLLLNNEGGIIDDLIVYRLGSQIYLLCVNSANIERDFEHLKKQAKHFTNIFITNVSADYSLLALQGPNSAFTLQKMTREQLPAKFFIKSMNLDGNHALVARTGYTGEDGFEIFVKNSETLSLYESILAHGEAFGLMPCGLAARDSLRLEAGLLLHGQDMDESVTPKEVPLMFAVDLTKPDFMGKRALLEHVAKKKLVGFKLLDKGIARHDFIVHDSNFNEIGKVTSATYLAAKKMAIGFAMIDKRYKMLGTKIMINIRGRYAPAEVTNTKFI